MADGHDRDTGLCQFKSGKTLSGSWWEGGGRGRGGWEWGLEMCTFMEQIDAPILSVQALLAAFTAQPVPESTINLCVAWQCGAMGAGCGCSSVSVCQCWSCYKLIKSACANQFSRGVGGYGNGGRSVCRPLCVDLGWQHDRLSPPLSAVSPHQTHWGVAWQVWHLCVSAGLASSWPAHTGKPVPEGTFGKQLGVAQARCAGAAVLGEGRLADWFYTLPAERPHSRQVCIRSFPCFGSCW